MEELNVSDAADPVVDTSAVPVDTSAAISTAEIVPTLPTANDSLLSASESDSDSDDEGARSIRSLWEEGTKNRRWKETAYATGYRMYSLMGPHELTRNALSLWVNLQVADMFRLSGDLAVSGSVSVGLFSSSY